MKNKLPTINLIITLITLFLIFTNSTRIVHAQSLNEYGFVYFCGLPEAVKPAISTINDPRLPSWWTNREKSACIIRQNLNIPSVKMEGYCSIFPNKSSPVDPLAPFCQGGGNEKVNGYVCNTGVNMKRGCGATGPADYQVTNLSGGSKLSLGDLKSKLGSNYKCGQTVQVDIFNKTCTDDMIYRHYQNVKNVPSGDADGDGIENHFESQYFVADANGTPTFCLAKDAFVWYTGVCPVEKKNPTCVLNGETSDMYVGSSRPFSAVSNDPDGGVTNLTQIYSSPTTNASWTYVGASNSNTTSGNFVCPNKGTFYITCNARDDEGVFCSGNPFDDKYPDCGSNDTKVVNCIDKPVVTPNLTIDKFIDSSKTLGTSPYKPNDVIAFGITVKNTGNVNLVDVMLTDTLPAYTEFDADKTKALNGGVLNWACTSTTCSYNRSLTLAVNESKTVYFAVKVKAYSTLGDIKSKNKVCANVKNVSEKCDEVPFELQEPTVKAITIDKTLQEAKDTYQANDTVKFKIVITNTGTSSLENVSLEDNIPALTQYDEQKTKEANAGVALWTCSSTSCTSSLGTLNAGASKTLYIVFKVLNYTATGDISSKNKACVTVLGLPKECDEVPFDLKDLPNPVKSIKVTKVIDQTKTEGDSPYKKDDKIAFLIEVKNTGNEDLTNVVLVDTIPVLTTFMDKDTATLNDQISLNKNWSCNNTTCSMNIGTMAVGQSIKTYFVAKISNYEIYDESIVSQNKACVSTTGVATSCATVTFNLLKLTRPGGSAVEITKEIFTNDSSPSQPFKENDSVIFRLRVKNTGETNLTSIQVEDTTPDYTVFDSETTNSLNEGWNCDGDSCFRSVDALSPNQEATLFYAVKILKAEADSGTDIKSENEACVEAIGTNPVEVSDCDKLTFDIKDNEEDTNDDKNEGDDVSISKKVRLEGQDRWEEKISDVSADDIIEFKIKVENKSGNNTSSIDNLKMEDKLPDELEKINGSLTVYWDDFDHDEDKTFIIKAKVRSSEFKGNVDECVDNKAIVLIDGDEQDEAEATVCYSNVELSELPDTGAGTNMTIFAIGVLLLGIYYRRQIHRLKPTNK